VSLGDMADVDFGDMLDYLAADPDTRAILLYVEGITQARKFMSAARAASRIKPVLVLKAGRSNAGARAATSHTGVLAGADAVYDAAFRRAGMLRVETMAELFDAAETLALTHKQVGEQLAILTNGGASGKRYGDALATLIRDPEVDAVLVLNCPTALAQPEEVTRAVVDAIAAAPPATL